ncbi:hypothetical protein [Sphingomonas immobilis]|uniref:Uncharacterized protein n=1 Tax=Sphingomonas immobilis TaxID=3063997 RepID=A0ABT9A041_9SPHN|nr:hypothetical protein [Sphingomonas sp. CA1-15]MDO7842822.1 hypothetical protein [Sphingomonas sp. CA1-15]
MKTTTKLAAALGLMVAGLGISTSASAQYYGGRGYNYDHRDDRRYDRYDRRDWRDGRRGYYGYDRGRRYGWGNNRRCHTEWRHHRRVTVCYR